jgi:hypothetical protein
VKTPVIYLQSRDSLLNIDTIQCWKKHQLCFGGISDDNMSADVIEALTLDYVW